MPSANFDPPCFRKVNFVPFANNADKRNAAINSIVTRIN